MKKALLCSIIIAMALGLTGCKSTETKTTGNNVAIEANVSEVVDLEITKVTAKDNDGNVPENVLDKDFGTRWSSPDSTWLIAELAKETEVSSINVSFSKGDQREFTFGLEVSTDGENWTEVFYGQSSGTTATLETYEFAAEKAKFVRFKGEGNTSNQWTSVTELEVMGIGTAKKKM